MDDTTAPDDYRSTLALLRSLESDELRIMHEQVASLVEHPGFQVVTRLMRLERETAVRRMTSSATLEHAKYAHLAGQVHGLAALWGVLDEVSTTHKRVQEQLAREAASDGES